MFADVKAVLFDLDGTLIDSFAAIAASVNHVRALRGLPSLPYELYRPMAGAGARGMLGVAFGMAPDHADFPAMREEFFRNYEACMTQRTYVFEGVSELIKTLTEHNVAWGVVTNKSMRFTAPLTKVMPLFASARAVVGGDSTPHAKPHPAPLLEAARQVGVKPIECLYVGDDVRDVQAGKAAGMPTVAALYGYLGSQADVKAWGADTQIETPLALLPLLKFRVPA